MADITQALTTLQDIIVPLIYPSGTSYPSITGKDVNIMPGWATKNELDAWLDAGKSLINIFPTIVEKDTTRYLKPWQLLTSNATTITAAVVDNVITLGGTVTVGEVIMTICNGLSYSYTEVSLDTLSSIAANIALLIPNTTAVGNVITIAGAYNLSVRIGGRSVMAREVKRQQREILIRVWTSGLNSSAIPDRSTLASAIDSHLSDIERFVLPDNTWARIHYCSSKEQDMLETDNCYVRDLNYYVEYPTIVTAPAYSVLEAQAVTTSQ